MAQTDKVCPEEAIGPMVWPKTTCFRTNYQQSCLGTESLTAQDDFSKNIAVARSKLCRLEIYLGNVG